MSTVSTNRYLQTVIYKVKYLPWCPNFDIAIIVPHLCFVKITTCHFKAFDKEVMTKHPQTTIHSHQIEIPLLKIKPSKKFHTVLCDTSTILVVSFSFYLFLFIILELSVNACLHRSPLQVRIPNPVFWLEGNHLRT